MSVKISYFSATGGEMGNLGIALSEIAEKYSIRIQAKTKVQLEDEFLIDDYIVKSLNSNLIYIGLHGGEESCPAFAPLMDAIEEKKRKGEKIPYVHIQGDMEALTAAQKYSTEGRSENWKKLVQFYTAGGVENLKNMVLLLANIVSDKDIPYDEPVNTLQQGIYHPDLKHLPDVDEYREKFLKKGQPVVGIWFYQTYWINKNLEHIDALIREIEKQGASVIAVFHNRYAGNKEGNMSVDRLVEHYFMDNGKPVIEVLLNAMNFSLNLIKPEFKGVIKGLGVPLLQTMVSTNSYADWKDGEQGVSTLDVIFSAAQPEFDGALINVNTGTRENDIVEPLTGAFISKNRPIPDRVEKLVSLALNWARLSHKKNEDKKVAVIFHHNPPRNDRIGCASGLDTFMSIKLLMDRMKEEGYVVERTYDDGDHMASEILERMTYDRRWETPDAMAEKAEAFAERETYMPWHETLPEKTRNHMIKNWGEMPGELFTYNDRINFAGTVNGNVFITMQPPRGKLENMEELVHDKHMSPPHHYLGTYRWIKNVFKADAVIHVGTHGTLEWLPGKALGLSEECYPDLAIMDLPNIYPYIINNPGEGTQAKRRSYCCIIDHMIPATTNSGLYEEMEKLDNAIRDYQDAERQDPEKLPIHRDLVWDAVAEAEIDKDMKITEEEAKADFETFMEEMHGYLEGISDTMISDGLHTMGTFPAARRLVEFIVQLTRLANDETPSLRESVIRGMGYDYDELLENKGRVLPHFNGRSGGQIVQMAHEKCLSIVEHIESKGFAHESIAQAVSDAELELTPQLEEVLKYIVDTLVPNIEKSVQEIDSILTALKGGFVEEGPSGAPTRGEANIFPTGRNFYSVDPSKLPSPGAWEVGVSLAEALIERSLKELNKYPEQVAVYITGTSTMRTKADTFAQVLYLMGVRPVWQNGGKVKGVEPIPLSELGRPRFDVTMRASGFFRDSFPNLMEMMDDAVKMVAALNEPPESNILRRNVYRDYEDYRKQGMSEADAKKESSFRVFSCPPGTYGAGVSELVESKQWESRDDLGNAYIDWSGHAYGSGEYGAKKPDTFKKVLSRIDATVQNNDSREYDMFSCTDYYNYYGGLIAAVKTVKGSYPMSVYGDTSDPRRVKVRTTDEEAKLVFRARLLNPKYIEGLKRHGYKGAGDLSKMMDVVLGWDATAEVVEDHMYDRFADKYALDPEMQKWMKEVNPYALQNIIDKLLEAIGRGMWNADEQREEALREAYLEIEGEIEDAVVSEKSLK